MAEAAYESCLWKLAFFFSFKFSPVTHAICVKTKIVYNGISTGLRGDWISLGVGCGGVDVGVVVFVAGFFA